MTMSASGFSSTAAVSIRSNVAPSAIPQVTEFTVSLIHQQYLLLSMARQCPLQQRRMIVLESFRQRSAAWHPVALHEYRRLPTAVLQKDFQPGRQPSRRSRCDIVHDHRQGRSPFPPGKQNAENRPRAPGRATLSLCQGPRRRSRRPVAPTDYRAEFPTLPTPIGVTFPHSGRKALRCGMRKMPRESATGWLKNAIAEVCQIYE